MKVDTLGTGLVAPSFNEEGLVVEIAAKTAPRGCLQYPAKTPPLLTET